MRFLLSFPKLYSFLQKLVAGKDHLFFSIFREVLLAKKEELNRVSTGGGFGLW